MLRRILSGRRTENPARRTGAAGFYSAPMKRGMVLAVSMFALGPVAAAPLTSAQMSAADEVALVTVPTPAEFFDAIDKISRPDWASFYRDPGPTSFPARPQTAFNLGALVTDGYIAVEAQDGQQVKNTGKDIIALARALGVGENVLARGKSIADFADKNDWFALREELEATTNEVRRAMVDQRDEALASLITAGAWLRALQVGGRAAELSGDPAGAALLGQQELVAYLNERVQDVPEKATAGPVVASVSQAFGQVQSAMAADEGASPGLEQAKQISETCAQVVAQMGAK
jgi:hypothetical protein